MARTKAEIRAFLDSQVGHICVDKSNGDLNGQCVCLIKNLMEFLGVGSPYAGRGNARDAGDTYIRQGIGKNGQGWLSVVVNRDMGLIGGVRYGHIWIDIANEANYESNGARAFVTTKNTRPIQQGQQFINFDQWVQADVPPKPLPPKEIVEMVTIDGLNVLYKFYLGSAPSEYGLKNRLGKQTFDQAATEIRASVEYKAVVEKIKETQGGLANHLPGAIQAVLKLPEQIKVETIKDS